MKTPAMQMTLSAWLILTAAVAVHIWLFQQSVLWGFIGLALTKHVVIAYLCHILGVDKDISSTTPSPALNGPHAAPPLMGGRGDNPGSASQIGISRLQ